MTATLSENFMDKINGMTIEGGEVTEDGMHLHLNDGYILIFSGAFVVGLFQSSDKRTLQ